MNSEFLLAKKYIFAQKRRSLFTIGSMMAAVAVMAVIFTAYSTFSGISRAAAFDKAPYHLCFMNVSAEQAELVSAIDGVKEAKISQNLSGGFCVELTFKPGSIKEAKIEFCHKTADLLGIDRVKFDSMTENGQIIFNDDLMSCDGIGFEAKYQNLVTFCVFFFYVIFAALALRFVIDTAFEISSKEREQQFGILQSIGAEPKQIVGVVTAEGMLLSAVGIPAGLIVGTAAAFAMFKAIIGSGIADVLFTAEKAEKLVHFKVDPLVLLIAAVTGFVWIQLSAYGTGMRIMKKSPIEAISARQNIVRKVKRHSLSGLFFGWKGKLAVRNARREKKRFIVTILSVTISITVFAGGTTVVGAVQKTLEQAFEGYDLNDFFILPVASAENNTPSVIPKKSYDFRNPKAYGKILRSIENSGLFKDIECHIVRYAKSDDMRYQVLYVNEYYYNSVFGGKPPVSYQELSESGGYMSFSGIDAPADIELDAIGNDLPKADYSGKDITFISSQVNTVNTPAVYHIAFSAEADENAGVFNDLFHIDGGHYNVIMAPLEMFDSGESKLYGNYFRFPGLNFDLADNTEHDKAASFLKNVISFNDLTVLDNYEITRQILSVMSGIRIGIAFITVMFILIALVNMVNIVSTGVINRKSELAAMQCVGMTRGQMYALSAVEALQYTVSAAVVSALICVLIVMGTRSVVALTVDDEDMYNKSYSTITDVREPLAKVGIASLAAYVTAFLSAVVPICSMQKESLADQIRSPE